MAQLRRLHALRWQSRGREGAFADHAARVMHERLVRALAGAATGGAEIGVDMLRVSAGEQVLGYLYNLVKGGVVAFYQSGLRYEPD